MECAVTSSLNRYMDKVSETEKAYESFENEPIFDEINDLIFELGYQTLNDKDLEKLEMDLDQLISDAKDLAYSYEFRGVEYDFTDSLKDLIKV